MSQSHSHYVLYKVSEGHQGLAPCGPQEWNDWAFQTSRTRGEYRIWHPTYKFNTLYPVFLVLLWSISTKAFLLLENIKKKPKHPPINFFLVVALVLCRIRIIFSLLFLFVWFPFHTGKIVTIHTFRVRHQNLILDPGLPVRILKKNIWITLCCKLELSDHCLNNSR